MILVINLSKPRKTMMNALTAAPASFSSILLGNSTYTQGIFNFLGIVGYPTLYTLMEINKIKKAVFPYSLSEFYKCYTDF